MDICFGTRPSHAAKSRPLAKAAPLPNGRYHGAGDERADARNGHQLAATLAAMRQNLDLIGDVLDTLIKTPPIAAEVFHDPDHSR